MSITERRKVSQCHSDHAPLFSVETGGDVRISSNLNHLLGLPVDPMRLQGILLTVLLTHDTNIPINFYFSTSRRP